MSDRGLRIGSFETNQSYDEMLMIEGRERRKEGKIEWESGIGKRFGMEGREQKVENEGLFKWIGRRKRGLKKSECKSHQAHRNRKRKKKEKGMEEDSREKRER